MELPDYPQTQRHDGVGTPALQVQLGGRHIRGDRLFSFLPPNIAEGIQEFFPDLDKSGAISPDGLEPNQNSSSQPKAPDQTEGTIHARSFISLKAASVKSKGKSDYMLHVFPVGSGEEQTHVGLFGEYPLKEISAFDMSEGLGKEQALFQVFSHAKGDFAIAHMSRLNALGERKVSFAAKGGAHWYHVRPHSKSIEESSGLSVVQHRGKGLGIVSVEGVRQSDYVILSSFPLDQELLYQAPVENEMALAKYLAESLKAIAPRQKSPNILVLSMKD